MTTAQRQRAKQVTADALGLAPAARPEFVASACAGDQNLHREVLRLLAEATSSETDFLSSPPLRMAGQAELRPCFSPEQIVAGRFRIERFINRGGMGEVYAATDLELRDLVALKTIRPAMAHSAAAIEWFKREVSQSRRITHPNVCRVHDMFSHEQPSGESLWFLTMELLHGRTLGDRLDSEGPWRVDEAIPLIRNMVSALAAAHALDIVHRDFKPNNVMLVQDEGQPERAVVTDFGLARNLTTNEVEARSETAAGTPAYMAPEQSLGREAGFAADQFALGLVICEMVTGKRPELDRTSAAELQRQLRLWLKSQPRAAIGGLRRVIVRCLQYRPEDRFREVRDILPALEGRWRSRSQRIAIAAAVVLLLAVSLLLALPDSRERLTDAVQLTSETGMSGSPSLSADGKWVAYTSDRGQSGNLDIWIQAAAGSDARRLTTHPAIDVDPAVSPDGALVAFRSEREGGGLYITSRDHSGERLVAPGGRSPSFSPDGRWIAYWTGTRDDAAPSGRLYKIPAEGGPSVRLAADFADARYPAWSSDGRFILFEGCSVNTSAVSTCADWWVVRPDGGGAINTGAVALLKSQKIEVQTPPLKSWRGDEVFFSGARGSAMALWAVRLSREKLRPVGPPRRITSGDARERDPSATAAGMIAFGRATGALHLWRVPIGPGSAGQQYRVTNDAGLDYSPSVSQDGRWLYFTRRTATGRHLMVVDLSSGREARLVISGPISDLISDDDKFWPVASPSGDRVAVEARRPLDAAIWLVERNGKPRRLCSGCSHPTSWVAERAVLRTTSKGEIAELDAATGRSRIVLSPEAGMALSGADWNAAHEYLIFTASRHGGARRGFAVHYPQSSGTPQGAWIPISPDAAEMEQAHWSKDGGTIFFLSKRDGNNCLWGVRFSAARRRVVGEPFPLMHYHDPRLTPDRASPLGRGLSVSSDSVFLNIGEVTTTVWLGRLAPPAWAIWRRWPHQLPFLQ